MATGNLTGGYVPPGFAEQWLTRAGQLSGPHLKHARRWLIVSGIFALIAGIIAFVVPVAASVTMSIFVGWVLIVSGVVMASHAFARSTPIRITLRLIEAIVTVLIGLYIVIFPLSGTVTLTFALAVWFFATGATQVVAAVVERELPARVLTGFSGAVSVVLGVLIAVSWPSSAAWAIGLLVGINLVFWGVRALNAAALLARLDRLA